MFQKGALSLLTEYGSDTSDDEVPGPKVSTKRTHKDDDETGFSNKKFKLPVPDILKTNMSEESQYTDDPDFHEGKIRSFPHERGNWATYVYIPYDPESHMKEFIEKTVNILPDSINIKNVEDYHLSLTKTVVLRYHWIEAFIQNVKNQVTSIKKFMILFDSVKVYCNEERTRTFLGIQIKSGYDTLIKLVEILDKCLEEFNLPPFYDDPSFHISIAWCVGDFQNEIEKYLPEINTVFLEYISKYSQDEDWYVLVDFLMCKTGNKFFQFYLS